MVEGAATWSSEIAGGRSCRPLGGAHPLDVFMAREQQALLPLPAHPFEMVEWATPVVAPDCRTTVLGAQHTVPWQYIGRHLDARASATTVEFFLDGRVVKTHVREPRGGRSIDWSDYPPDKIAFLQRTPAWCRRRAGETGPSVAAVVGELLSVNVLHRLRAAQGILRLGDRYGADRLDAACELALGAGDPSYRTIKGVLEAGYDRAPAAERRSTADIPAYLDGPDTLFEEVSR